VKLSIRQIFFNLKLALIVLVIGTLALGIQIFTISQYSNHLSALKNQHSLVKKIMTTNLNDINMANITVKGTISELALFTQLATRYTFVDTIVASSEEDNSLNKTLSSASSAFQESALFWIESMPVSRDAMYHRMESSRNSFFIEIDKMMDYQIQRIDKAINIAKIILASLIFLTIVTYFFYRMRLNQIYSDINRACNIDSDISKIGIRTNEINTIFKHLARKASTNPTLLHHQTGMTNEKGMQNAYSLKNSQKKSSSYFLVVFEIDQYESLSSTLSKDEMGGLLKKLGTIISMYEQASDVAAHLDDDSFAFLLSRNDKKIALSEIYKIISSVNDSVFTSSKGALKITLSAGFILKVPSKSLDDSLIDAKKITKRAKELGGNRIMQQHEVQENFQ
jgi:GGDEF domain-containing protein